MALQVTKEPLENRQLALTIEVEPARVEQELRKAARKAARDFRIPGFRKGKAPFSVVVQYVGLPALYQEFMDDLGQELYKEAIEQENLEPYAMASLDDVEFEPMRYKLIVPLEPEIDLGDYRSLRVDPVEPEVSDEEIEARLEEYTSEDAGWRDVNRPSEYGDLMTIDVHSVLDDTPEGEEPTVVLDEEDWEVTPDQEYPMDPPGFDEALLGLQVGDEKEVQLSWPEDSQSIYAGQSATFSIQIKQVQAFQNAELTDELAQSIGPDFETVEDLRQSVRETIAEEKRAEAEEAYLTQVMDVLREQSTLNYPPVVVEDQLDSMLDNMAQQVRGIGFDTLEAYFEAIGQDTDEFREQQRLEAVRLAERNLILSEIVNVEKMRANDAELEEHIRNIMGVPEGEESEQYLSTLEMFRDGPGRPMIESQILTEKALEFIRAVAMGEEVPEPPSDAEADAAEDAVAHEEAEAAEETNETVSAESTGAEAASEADPAGSGNEAADEATVAQPSSAPAEER